MKACAKMRMSNEVTTEDVAESIRLMKVDTWYWYQVMKFDIGSYFYVWNICRWQLKQLQQILEQVTTYITSSTAATGVAVQAKLYNFLSKSCSLCVCNRNHWYGHDHDWAHRSGQRLDSQARRSRRPGGGPCILLSSCLSWGWRLVPPPEYLRGTGFEPAQAYATRPSTVPLWPDSGTPAGLFI